MAFVSAALRKMKRMYPVGYAQGCKGTGNVAILMDCEHVVITRRSHANIRWNENRQMVCTVCEEEQQAAAIAVAEKQPEVKTVVAKTDPKLIEGLGTLLQEIKKLSKRVEELEEVKTAPSLPDVAPDNKLD